MDTTNDRPREERHGARTLAELEQDRWRWECRALLAEGRATAAERRLELMTATLREAYFVFDVTDQRLVTVTPAYERLVGRSAARAHEDLESFLEAFRPGDRDRALSVLCGTCAESWPKFLVETPEGSIRAVRWRMEPWPDMPLRTHGVMLRVARGASLRVASPIHAGPGYERRMAG